ncbi:Uncharacterised protein [Segatella copri]|nr:Uncharacterised protein [Segatella copri]
MKNDIVYVFLKQINTYGLRKIANHVFYSIHRIITG